MSNNFLKGIVVFTIALVAFFAGCDITQRAAVYIPTNSETEYIISYRYGKHWENHLYEYSTEPHIYEFSK